MEIINILDMGIDGIEYTNEMGVPAGGDVPIRWKTENGKIHITGKVSVRDVGTMRHFVVGSHITNVERFAGKGANKPFDKAEIFSKAYGGKSEDWFRGKGIGLIGFDDVHKEANVHWFECEGIGSVRRKVKDYTGNTTAPVNTIKKEGVSLMKRDYVTLTESGIDFGDGNIIAEGRVLEIAREAKALFEDGKHSEFAELMASSESELTEADYQQLVFGISIFEDGDGFIEKMVDLDDEFDILDMSIDG